MKLTYWCCPCLTDNRCYSVVAKTKKEAESSRKLRGAENYGPAEKCVLYYADAFDLMVGLTSEGGGRGSSDE